MRNNFLKLQDYLKKQFIEFAKNNNNNCEIKWIGDSILFSLHGLKKNVCWKWHYIHFRHVLQIWKWCYVIFIFSYKVERVYAVLLIEAAPPTLEH